MTRPTRAERQAQLVAQTRQAQTSPSIEREPSAREKLATLDEQRRANNGYIVPAPRLQTREDVRAWLRAVSEVGNSGDVEIAWHYVQDIHIKGHLYNEYVALMDQAGRRHNELIEAVMAEERVASAEHAERTRKANLQRDLAAAEAEVADLKRQLSV